jgi:uncharacterized protein
MESPFIFGRKATGKSFTDREKETQKLISNFRNKVNTVVISPRRWGKSSLVKKAGELAESNSLIIVYIDAFSVRDAREFYTVLANSVIKATSNKVETIIDLIKRFFSRISPKISVGTDPISTIELSFELDEVENNYQELLDLPEKISLDKGISLIICIDEFQNTALFNESSLFHKRLRSAWQNHQNVTYCIYGSKQHMMNVLFEKQSMPFYKFGEIIHLGKISKSDWVLYITNQFHVSGKYISDSLAEKIAEIVKCHSYYVQQLSHLIWERTSAVSDDSIYEEALNDLISQNSLLYQREAELLSFTQINFLKALASGTVSGFNFKETMNKFNLGSSANVSKIKKILIEKELIEIKGQEAEFLDPAYELWFRREILKQKIT